VEMFGILCSIPTAFLATALYVVFFRRALRHPLIRKSALAASAMIFLALALEWILLVTVGIDGTCHTLGRGLYPIHLAVFLLAVPALANVLTITGDTGLLGRWFVVAALGAVLALPVVLTQYYVSEALYGLNGDKLPGNGC
jgi:hypothetical protein